MPTPRRRLGTAGEQHARRYLETKGYALVTANWHCPDGEIDLAMRDGDELVFVEVKTRHGERLGRAEESVSVAQTSRLLAAAEWFLADHPELQTLIWRIDIVALTLAADGRVLRLSHIENAVTAD